MDDPVQYTQITRVCYFELIQDPGYHILQVEYYKQVSDNAQLLYTVGISSQWISMPLDQWQQSFSAIITTDLSVAIATRFTKTYQIAE